MLPLAHIPVQPSSQDCLAWSSDGELAVAAGEEVYLLIPKDGSPEPWTHLRINVSNFTTEEWPLQEQASFRDMSIGEEQAKATVTALAWSPSGLAKHRRSVLAVLTSNLILSLWSSDSTPNNLDSWKRVLVVNKVLFSGSRLQQRIRSIAWAPPNPRCTDRRTPFSRHKWGIPLIAIADDRNGLYILEISSPFAGHSFAWKAEILCRHNIPMSKKSDDRPSLLNLALNASHFIDRIEFGRWDGDISLVYRTSGTTHHARISAHEDLLSQVQLQDTSGSESYPVSLDQARPGDAKMFSRPMATPLIEARMTTEKQKFGLDKNIGNHVMLRTWGLASFNDLVAACITLHPAKMVEYTQAFQETATILVSAGDDNENAKSVFPWQKSVEVDVTKAQGYILDTILDQNLHKSLALNDFDLKIMYTAFCGSLLLSDVNHLQRLQSAGEILNLIEHYTNIDLQAERRALHTIKTSYPLSDQELMNTIRQMTEARAQAESRSRIPEKFLLDLCPFCPEVQPMVPLSSFTEACCLQNHRLGRLLSLFFDSPFLTSEAARCAITFLPLLEPGIAKRCIKCKREVFDEWAHPEIHMRLSQRLGPINTSNGNIEDVGPAQGASGLVKHSLASALFDKFDTCPYCGGKFCD